MALMACQGAVYGTEPGSPDKADVKNNSARVQLRTEPALQRPISGEFHNPKVQDIIDLVRKETGQRLSLDASVIQDRPLQGHTLLSKVPAWAALENLARNQYIKGYWTKRGEKYVLVATYSGTPPPLPSQPPPHLREAMEKAEKGLPPAPPSRTPPEKRRTRRIWWAASSLTFTVIFIGLLFLRRKSGPPTTSKAPPSKESKLKI
ncbi:MAG TPA: hypothetical protein VH682_11905 [Gemmataceae bacterium]